MHDRRLDSQLWDTCNWRQQALKIPFLPQEVGPIEVVQRLADIFEAIASKLASINNLSFRQPGEFDLDVLPPPLILPDVNIRNGQYQISLAESFFKTGPKGPDRLLTLTCWTGTDLHRRKELLWLNSWECPNGALPHGNRYFYYGSARTRIDFTSELDYLKRPLIETLGNWLALANRELENITSPGGNTEADIESPGGVSLVEEELVRYLDIWNLRKLKLF